MRTGVLWNEVVTATHKSLRARRQARAHSRRQLRHAAHPQSEAVRRHRHRQPVRRRALRRGRHGDGLARHAAVGVARRAGREDGQAASRSTSPCTARRPTSRARVSPTRLRPSPASGWRCAIPATWGRKPTRSTRRSRTCSRQGYRTGDIMQPGMRQVGTREMGGAIVDELGKLAS